MRLNNNYLTILLALFIASAMVVSCGGNEEDEPTTPSTVEEDYSSNNNGSGGDGSSSNGQDSNKNPDYKSILLKHKTWSWYKGQNNNGLFTFYGSNSIQFLQAGSSNVGSYGVPSLDARGTFNLSGTKLECYYEDISINPSSASNQFPNWKIGSARKIIYTIDKLTDEELILKEGNTKYILSPLY